MREILFRGKNSKGEWLYGDLLQLNKRVFVAPADGDWFDFMPHNKSSLGILSGNYCVAPSSVGQFTGLLDKNGTKIFEEDIIESKGVKHVIRYSNRDAAFYAELITINYSVFCKVEQNWITQFSKSVVGNITDNPELRKENDYGE